METGTLDSRHIAYEPRGGLFGIAVDSRLAVELSTVALRFMMKSFFLLFTLKTRAEYISSLRPLTKSFKKKKKIIISHFTFSSHRFFWKFSLLIFFRIFLSVHHEINWPQTLGFWHETWKSEFRLKSLKTPCYITQLPRDTTHALHDTTRVIRDTITRQSSRATWHESRTSSRAHSRDCNSSAEPHYSQSFEHHSAKF